MCHESAGSALGGHDRHRQGHRCCSRTSTRADLIIVVGQNPGTNHPRMLSALEKAKAARRQHHHRQPARPRPACERFHNPQTAAAACSRDRTSPTSCSCRSGSAATRRCSPLLARLDRRGRRRRHGSSSRRTARSTTSSPPRLRAADWDDVLAATGLTARPDRGARRVLPRVRADHRVLGDGPDPAPRLRRHHPARSSTCMLLRGNIGKPGAGAVPGPGPLQRPGRPHDGHLREGAGPAFLDAARRRVRLRPAPRARPRLVDTIRAMRDGRVRAFFSPWAATSSPRPPTPPRPPRRWPGST